MWSMSDDTHSFHCLWLMLAVNLSRGSCGVATAGQTRTVPSTSPDTTRDPSGMNATSVPRRRLRLAAPQIRARCPDPNAHRIVTTARHDAPTGIPSAQTKSSSDTSPASDTAEADTPWHCVPERQACGKKVNDLLATGASYAMVLRALGEDNAELDKR